MAGLFLRTGEYNELSFIAMEWRFLMVWSIL